MCFLRIGILSYVTMTELPTSSIFSATITVSTLPIPIYSEMHCTKQHLKIRLQKRGGNQEEE